MHGTSYHDAVVGIFPPSVCTVHYVDYYSAVCDALELKSGWLYSKDILDPLSEFQLTHYIDTHISTRVVLINPSNIILFW